MNNELTLNELSNKVVSLEKQLEELKKVEIQVKEFNEALFKAFNLDLWEEYCEEVTKKGKAGYVRITLPKKGENND